MQKKRNQMSDCSIELNRLESQSNYSFRILSQKLTFTIKLSVET